VISQEQRPRETISQRTNPIRRRINTYVEPLQSSNRRNDSRYITPGISPCARGSRVERTVGGILWQPHARTHARTHACNAHIFAHAITNIQLAGNTAESINRRRPGAAKPHRLHAKCLSFLRDRGKRGEPAGSAGMPPSIGANERSGRSGISKT